MSGPWHPTGRGSVNARNPRPLAVCDRCSFVYNIDALTWQYQWSGVKLQNLRLLVCPECLDKPQPQLKTIVIPPDPMPVLNPRPEQYAVTVPSFMATETPSFEGSDLTTESGDNLIWEDETTPLPDPNNPAIIPPQV